VRTLTRRVELLEARQRAAAGETIEGAYDRTSFLASLSDDELSTLEQLSGVDPAAMSGDDLEFMASLAERLQTFRLDR